jgi:hypothetical protein
VPVRFGSKKLYLTCHNDGPDVISVKVNGEDLDVTTSGEIDLIYSELPEDAAIEITTGGGWPAQLPTVAYPLHPSLTSGNETKGHERVEFTDTMKKTYAILCEMNKLLASENEADYDKAFVSAAIKSFDDYLVRAAMDHGPGYFRPITSQRREGINNFYEQAALSMYTGLANRMADYAGKGDSRQKHIAELFSEAQKY